MGSPYRMSEEVAKEVPLKKVPSGVQIFKDDASGDYYFEYPDTGETAWILENDCSKVQKKLDACLSRNCGSGAAAPAAAAANNSGPAAKFKKMLKMGIPRSAVEQKMKMEGLDPGLLNGKAAAPAADATDAAAPIKKGGPPAFLAGIGAAKLKKVNAPSEKPAVKPNNKPKNAARGAAASIAEEARKKAEERAKRSTMTIEERLAAQKAEKAKPENAPLKKELLKKVKAKNNATYKILKENTKGRLPGAWVFVKTADDEYYHNEDTGVSQYNRPGNNHTRRRNND
jgi:hypothetical protein